MDKKKALKTIALKWPLMGRSLFAGLLLWHKFLIKAANQLLNANFSLRGSILNYKSFDFQYSDVDWIVKAKDNDEHSFHALSKVIKWRIKIPFLFPYMSLPSLDVHSSFFPQFLINSRELNALLKQGQVLSLSILYLAKANTTQTPSPLRLYKTKQRHQELAKLTNCEEVNKLSSKIINLDIYEGAEVTNEKLQTFIYLQNELTRKLITKLGVNLTPLRSNEGTLLYEESYIPNQKITSSERPHKETFISRFFSLHPEVYPFRYILFKRLEIHREYFHNKSYVLFLLHSLAFEAKLYPTYCFAWLETKQEDFKTKIIKYEKVLKSCSQYTDYDLQLRSIDNTQDVLLNFKRIEKFFQFLKDL